MADKSCYTCKHFAQLKEPWTRSDGSVIYGYCFVDGSREHNPNLGRGYTVFHPSGACKTHVRKRVAKASELKPCPFCGGDADCNNAGLTDKDGNPLWWVECPACGITTGGSATAAEAAEIWNRRADNG